MNRNSSCSYTVLGGEKRTNHNENDQVKMRNNWEKFKLLLWKNFMLQYRRPIQSILEILAPVLFSVLLVVIRSLIDPEAHEQIIYSGFNPIEYMLSPSSTFQKLKNSNNSTNYSLLYSPAGNIHVTNTVKLFKALNISLIPLNSSKDIDDYVIKHSPDNILAAIQFNDSLNGNVPLPDDLEIVLRFPSELKYTTSEGSIKDWKTFLKYPIYQVAGPRNPDSKYGAIPSYYYEGFLSLQYIITAFLGLNQLYGGNIDIKSLSPLDLFTVGIDKIPIIEMRRYPYSSWVEDPLLQALISFTSLIIMLSFVYTCINTVKAINTEKEKQLKESMKIMGLPSWLHWLAWFIKTFVVLFISVVCIVILLKVSWYPNTNYSVFTYANPLVILLFLVFYICSVITFCFLISVFFSRANTASTIAGLAWFVAYFPYAFLQMQYDTLSLTTKLLSSIGCNAAMSYGFQLILMFEGTGEGIQWNNIFSTNTTDDNLTLGHIMMMLVIDSIIYLLVALYVEAIFPGDYGVAQPWYFPFTKSYWCGHPPYIGVEDFDVEPANEGTFFEAEPSNLHPGIQIKNLRKVYKNKAAVRNLSLNLYEDQITVLLGHNGAGKTTTMSMLTGMITPTSGTAIVAGYDIRTDIRSVRESLGLCPQHNILFDDLTVREHLYFFSKLKGLDKKEIENEIQRYVNLLELQPKIDAKSSSLSGGMKRKLCVGIALCGNSKVVMLDEPTAGMDPSARRALWNLLQKQKKGRTILLSTHFMDEADLLGDRIAIMAGGQLQCSGSSFFLKRKYGAGYSLIMDKSSDCIAENVTDLLKKYIPNIKVQSDVGSELSYLLDEHQSSIFEEMLHDLEMNSEVLGIRSYGISLTTLEEVFLKVGADHGQEEEYNNVDGTIKTSSLFKSKIFNFFKTNTTQTQETKVPIEEIQLLSGFQLIKNQILAMFMKKTLSSLRTWILLVIQLFMPVVLMVFAIIVVKSQGFTGSLPKLSLSLDDYNDPVTLIQGDDKYANTYANLVKPHTVKRVDNIIDEMLNLTKKTPTSVRQRYIVGASFQTDLVFRNITAWFNNDPLHSPGLALGLVLNTVYKNLINESKNLRFSNYPLPYKASTKINLLIGTQNFGFQLGLNICFSMCFVSSFYVLFMIKERISKSKHLQFVSGVKVWIFWTVTYFCDFLTFLCNIILLLLTLISFQENGFKTAEEIGRVAIILLYFGIAMLPMEYVASFFFIIPSTGFTRMTLFSIFTGVAVFMVVNVLSTPAVNLQYVVDGLHWFFLLFPHYSLAAGFQDNYITWATSQMCTQYVDLCAKDAPIDYCWDQACHNTSKGLTDYCCDRVPRYFKWERPGLARNIVYSFLFSIIVFVGILCWEYQLFAKIINKMKKNKENEPVIVEDEDDDVLAEKKRIRNTPETQLKQENILILKNLTKYYKKFLAVNNLCLGTKRKECFGLLGINGAGKTTTFKMMTGDISISSGDIWVGGYNIKTDLKQVQKLIGYCPQFDALLDNLTAKESITMFALLRGVPLEECSHLAEKLSKDFDFNRHLNKQIRALSGGNKRKISTAISLIGDPPVIYLDEPTTGMDPAAKRYLWNALCAVRDNGKCIILTSHSMEECEALCTRLAIMVNGNFKCLGSTQHLKNKFSDGYTLMIKIKKIDNLITENQQINVIEQFIKEQFPGSIQREKHQELLTYYIVDKSKPWSRMFGILEKAKKELHIEDYSLGQSSLEQVFLTFTRHQR